MTTQLAVNLGAAELLILMVVLGVMAVPLVVIALLVGARRRN
jgi:hypothetical protein